MPKRTPALIRALNKIQIMQQTIDSQQDQIQHSDEAIKSWMNKLDQVQRDNKILENQRDEAKHDLNRFTADLRSILENMRRYNEVIPDHHGDRRRTDRPQPIYEKVGLVQQYGRVEGAISQLVREGREMNCEDNSITKIENLYGRR